MQKEKERIIAFDILRIVAILMVLFNHRYTYQAANTYDNIDLIYIIKAFLALICKCGPAIFFAVSGALLLGKEEKFSYIFKHRIIKILIGILICSFLVMDKDGYKYNYLKALTKCNWYLYHYLAYLFILPLLRKLTNKFNKIKMNTYLVSIYIIYTLCSIGAFYNIFDKISILKSLNASHCWFIIFPITGYFIYKVLDNKEKERKFFVVALILSIISIVFGITLCTYDIKLHNASNIEDIRQYFIYPITGLIFIISLVIGKHIKSNTLKKILYICSNATYGCFLIDTHTNLGGKLLFDLNGLLPPMDKYIKNLLCILYEFITYTVIISILRKIPIIKKIV